MVQKITGQQPFQVLATNFSISPSLQNTILQISANGTDYSDLFTISAGQTKMVTNVANGSYYRLKNNASEVTINWRTQCNDGQGGGGGSYILPPATEQTLGGVKVGSGLTVQADGTLSAEGGEGGDNTILKSVNELPESADTGDVVALSSETGETITFNTADVVFGEGEDILKLSGDGLRTLTANAFYDEDNQVNVLKFAIGMEEDYLVEDGSSVMFPASTDDELIWEWIAELNDGVVTIKLYDSDNDAYLPLSTSNISLNVCDAKVNGTFVGVYQYDGSAWNQVGGAGGVLVVDSLSSQEAASAPVGSLIGQYKSEESVWKEMPTTDSDVNASKILVNGDVDFSNARVQINLLNSNYYFEVGRSNGKWTKINKGNLAGSWKLDGVDIGGSVTGEYDGDVLKLYDGDETVWSVTFTKQENGDWIGEIAGGVNPHYKCITNLTGINAFKYETISPIEANLYMKVLGGTVAHWQGIRDANQVESFEIIYDDLYDFTSFCDNKIMFSIRYQYGGETRYAFMDATNQSIVLYSDSGKTTEITRVSYLGNPVKFETQ